MAPARRLFALARRLRAPSTPPALPALLAFTDPVRTPDPAALATSLPRGAGLVFRAFGAADADRLFGDEERAARVAIEQRRVLLDDKASAADRDRRLADLEQRLPEAAQRAREDATRPLVRRAEEEAMRRAGASDDDVRAYRVASAGEEAAERLAALDQRRAAWKARVDAFRAARAEVQRTEADPARQRAEVQRLLEGSFTPLERIRGEAKESMDSP